MSALADALAAGTIADRVWFYANYHCNLQCSYCLTESVPLVKRRELGREPSWRGPAKRRTWASARTP